MWLFYLLQRPSYKCLEGQVLHLCEFSEAVNYFFFHENSTSLSQIVNTKAIKPTLSLKGLRKSWFSLIAAAFSDALARSWSQRPGHALSVLPKHHNCLGKNVPPSLEAEGPRSWSREIRGWNEKGVQSVLSGIWNHWELGFDIFGMETGTGREENELGCESRSQLVWEGAGLEFWG